MKEEGLSNIEKGKKLSPQEREKLLRELKERLKEIACLREELGMKKEKESSFPAKRAPFPSDEDDSSLPVSIGRVREEVEELRVPALELLDDKPLAKKKKEGNAT